MGGREQLQHGRLQVSLQSRRQREIERIVRDGKVEGGEPRLRITLTAGNAPVKHVVEQTIDLR